ncbi:MAG: transposase [Tissierellia bacterium]|nr:transposase [Tissierellia bacterium]
MPRDARKRSSSGVYHVMLRGINRQTIFESDGDRYQFLKTLNRFVDEKKFILYGYCLMDNHVHLLIQELEDDISNAIKRISSSYVLWYNKKYERCGHLFQERFKSEPVEADTYLITVLRYIHQNPIEAKICKHMLDYKWTSYKEYIKEAILIDTELCLSLFSPDKDKAVDLFIEYMNEKNDDSCSLFEDYYKLTDNEVINKIHDMGISNISEFQKLEKNIRDKFLKELKKTKGISLRQLSRITGISKSVIGNL